MRHATDADHVVAIATIISRERTMKELCPDRSRLGDRAHLHGPGGRHRNHRFRSCHSAASWTFDGTSAVGIMLVVLGVLTLTGIGRAVGILAGAGAPGGRMLDIPTTTCMLTATTSTGTRTAMNRTPHGHAEHQTPLARPRP